jgi:hypothetical protein
MIVYIVIVSIKCKEEIKEYFLSEILFSTESAAKDYLSLVKRLITLGNNPNIEWNAFIYEKVLYETYSEAFPNFSNIMGALETIKNSGV